MTQQKALFIVSKQGSWEVQDRPIPKPGNGEVLVKILSTALNPVDWKIQKRGYFLEQYPAVIGSDSSGEVVEVGAGVTSFSKGDRVVHQGWFMDNDGATFQQYALVPAAILAKIPSSLSFDEASTLPLGLATAALGLYNRPDAGGIGLTPGWIPEGKNKYQGQPIVILGGSSSVGQFTLQVARLSGFSPIITTASLKHAEFLKSLGATHVVDRSITDPADKIKSILPDGTTGIVYDAISVPDTQKIALEVLKPDGSLLLTLPRAEGLSFGQRTIINTFGNVHPPPQRDIGVSLYSALPQLLKDGSIKPNRVELLPGGLQAIPEGLEKLFEDKVSGVKLVVRPWE